MRRKSTQSIQLFLIFGFLALVDTYPGFAGKENSPHPQADCDNPNFPLNVLSSPARVPLPFIADINARLLTETSQRPVLPSAQGEWAIPLSELIAASLDNDGKHPIQNLDSLANSARTNIHPDRLSRVNHLLTLLSNYQFESKQVIRELVANAQDSYVYANNKGNRNSPTQLIKPSAEIPEVKVVTREGGFSVTDHGLGMSLNDVILYLLTPGRSKNPALIRPDEALADVTGRFGQGFFSILSYLRDPGDKIEILTHSHGNPPVRLQLVKDSKGVVQVHFMQVHSHSASHSSDPVPLGTEIQVQAAQLKGTGQNEGVASLVASLKDAFHLSQKGKVLVKNNDEPSFHQINPAIHARAVEFSEGAQVRILPSDSSSSDAHLNSEEGLIYITVNGVVIKKIPYQGIHIHPKIELILPPDTQLTPERGTLNLEDPKLRSLLRNGFEQLARSNEIALLNSLVPVLGDLPESFISSLNLDIREETLPAVEAAKGVVSIESHGKQQQHALALIHPLLFKKLQRKRPLVGPLGIQHEAIAIHGTFSHPAQHFALIENQGRPILVVDPKIDFHTPLVQTLFNNIYFNREKTRLKSKEQTQPLFTVDSSVEFLAQPKTHDAGDASIPSHVKQAESVVGFKVEDWTQDCEDENRFITTRGGRNQKKSDAPEVDLALLEQFNHLLLSSDWPADLSIATRRQWLKLLARKYDRNFPLPSARTRSKQEIKKPDITEIHQLLKLYPKGPAYLDKIIDPENDFILGRSGPMPVIPWHNFIIRLLEKNLKPEEFNNSMQKLVSIHEMIGPNLFLNKPDIKIDHLELALRNSLPEGQTTWRQVANQSQLNQKLDRAIELTEYFQAKPDGRTRPSREDWAFLDEIEEFLSNKNFALNENLIHLLLGFEPGHRSKHIDQIKDLIEFKARMDVVNLDNSSQILEPRVEEFINHVFNKVARGESTTSEFQGLKSFFETASQLRSMRKAESPTELFRFWKQEGIFNEQTYPILFPLLFSDLVKVDHDSWSRFPGDHLPRGSVQDSQSSNRSSGLIPIEHHPLVQQILGGSEEDRTKEYYLAMNQHSSQTAWIKELVKNSKEAKANEISLDFSLDQKGQLVMNFEDDGNGVPRDKIHAFYIPKFSTKEKLTSDVNFGWGFFTLFKFFDEVVVESAEKGAPPALIYLKKTPEGRILLEELASGFESGLSAGKSGTRISARVNEHAPSFPDSSQTHPTSDQRETWSLGAIIGHLAEATGALSSLGVKLNGKPFLLRGDSPLAPYNRLATQPLHEVTPSGQQSFGTVEVYLSSQPGLYYEDQRFHGDWNHFIPKNIPQLIRDKLISNFGIRLNAPLQQNDRRTVFLNQNQWEDSVHRAVYEASERFVEKRVIQSPRQFPLPSDYFNKFGEHRNQRDPTPGWMEKVQKAEDLTEPVKRFLNPDRLKVIQQLEKLKIIDTKGNYLKTDSVPKLNLVQVLGEDKAALAEVFETEILASLKSIARQSEDDPDTGQDFSTDRSASELESRGDLPPSTIHTIRALAGVSQDIVKHYLNRTVDVNFYKAADSSIAHARQSSHSFAFNLAPGGFLTPFSEYLSDGKMPVSRLSRLLDTITHELTHTEEEIFTNTHDSRFYQAQEAKLSEVLSDVSYLKTLFSNPNLRLPVNK